METTTTTTTATPTAQRFSASFLTPFSEKKLKWLKSISDSEARAEFLTEPLMLYSNVQPTDKGTKNNVITAKARPGMATRGTWWRQREAELFISQ